ncbi:primase-helicase family protein [Rubrivivax albus]|uniref:Uncharacterized protein n=1 Tax=Rubrivivax albus TaxID=2499835 RepID=A0A437JNV0_9BURK|nr:primase-helicase family protein [Rubrivivax albus]RVT48554.1 hypothetical protein ENE75_23030 [Rubrivivax albus]
MSTPRRRDVGGAAYAEASVPAGKPAEVKPLRTVIEPPANAQEPGDAFDQVAAGFKDFLGGLAATQGCDSDATDEAPPEVVADVAVAASPGLADKLAPHASTPVSDPTSGQLMPLPPQKGIETEPPGIDETASPQVQAINRNTFVSHAGNGVMGIFREARDHETRQHQVTPMTEEQLSLEHSAAPAVSVTRGGNRRYVNAGKAWTLWPGRRTYPDGIGMWPDGDAPAGAYNLYRGSALEPMDGDAKPIVEHIAYMCGGSGPLAEWVLNWLAFTVQAPGRRPETALVLRGGQGTGKGTLARLMLRFFGGHGLHLTQQKHLTGAFNGHLRYALLVVADCVFHVIADTHFTGSRTAFHGKADTVSR